MDTTHKHIKKCLQIKKMTEAEKGKIMERWDKYKQIAERAEKSGIYDGERQNLIMDLESADKHFILRLDDLLNADDGNFAHDVIGIISNIDRSTFPAKNFNCFVPRFAQND